MANGSISMKKLVGPKLLLVLVISIVLSYSLHQQWSAAVADLEKRGLTKGQSRGVDAESDDTIDIDSVVPDEDVIIDSEEHGDDGLRSNDLTDEMSEADKEIANGDLDLDTNRLGRLFWEKLSPEQQEQILQNDLSLQDDGTNYDETLGRVLDSNEESEFEKALVDSEGRGEMSEKDFDEFVRPRYELDNNVPAKESAGEYYGYDDKVEDDVVNGQKQTDVDATNQDRKEAVDDTDDGTFGETFNEARWDPNDKEEERNVLEKVEGQGVRNMEFAYNKLVEDRDGKYAIDIGADKILAIESGNAISRIGNNDPNGYQIDKVADEMMMSNHDDLTNRVDGFGGSKGDQYPGSEDRSQFESGIIGNWEVGQLSADVISDHSNNLLQQNSNLGVESLKKETSIVNSDLNQEVILGSMQGATEDKSYSKSGNDTLVSNNAEYDGLGGSSQSLSHIISSDIVSIGDGTHPDGSLMPGTATQILESQKLLDGSENKFSMSPGQSDTNSDYSPQLIPAHPFSDISPDGGMVQQSDSNTNAVSVERVELSDSNTNNINVESFSNDIILENNQLGDIKEQLKTQSQNSEDPNGARNLNNGINDGAVFDAMKSEIERENRDISSQVSVNQQNNAQLTGMDSAEAVNQNPLDTGFVNDFLTGGVNEPEADLTVLSENNVFKDLSEPPIAEGQVTRPPTFWSRSLTSSISAENAGEEIEEENGPQLKSFMEVFRSFESSDRNEEGNSMVDDNSLNDRLEQVGNVNSDENSFQDLNDIYADLADNPKDDEYNDEENSPINNDPGYPAFVNPNARLNELSPVKTPTTPNTNGGSYDNPRPLSDEEYNALNTKPSGQFDAGLTTGSYKSNNIGYNAIQSQNVGIFENPKESASNAPDDAGDDDMNGDLYDVMHRNQEKTITTENSWDVDHETEDMSETEEDSSERTAGEAIDDWTPLVCPQEVGLSATPHLVTALVAFPGAVADWLRTTIEQLSGESSDSLYNVMARLRSGDPSALFQMPRHSVIHTHSVHSADFDRAILVVNNPVAVESKHLAFLPFALEWRRYFLWDHTIISWLSSDIPLLVLTTDDLIYDPQFELNKIATFLGIDQESIDMTCALEQEPPILIDDVTKMTGVYSNDRRRLVRSIDAVIEAASKKAPDILHRLFQYKTVLYI